MAGEMTEYQAKRIDVGDCWLWTGPTAGGYGMDKQHDRVAHRLIWEALVGPVATEGCGFTPPDLSGLPFDPDYDE